VQGVEWVGVQMATKLKCCGREPLAGWVTSSSVARPNVARCAVLVVSWRLEMCCGAEPGRLVARVHGAAAWLHAGLALDGMEPVAGRARRPRRRRHR
jgi:hypothetical protein